MINHCKYEQFVDVVRRRFARSFRLEELGFHGRTHPTLFVAIDAFRGCDVQVVAAVLRDMLAKREICLCGADLVATPRLRRKLLPQMAI